MPSSGLPFRDVVLSSRPPATAAVRLQPESRPSPHVRRSTFRTTPRLPAGADAEGWELVESRRAKRLRLRALRVRRHGPSRPSMAFASTAFHLDTWPANAAWKQGVSVALRWAIKLRPVPGALPPLRSLRREFIPPPLWTLSGRGLAAQRRPDPPFGRGLVAQRARGAPTRSGEGFPLPWIARTRRGSG